MFLIKFGAFFILLFPMLYCSIDYIEMNLAAENIAKAIAKVKFTENSTTSVIVIFSILMSSWFATILEEEKK